MAFNLSAYHNHNSQTKPRINPVFCFAAAFSCPMCFCSLVKVLDKEKNHFSYDKYFHLKSVLIFKLYFDKLYYEYLEKIKR